MWEILYLYQPAGFPPGTVGAVKLQQAPDTVIRADTGFYGVIFLCAGFPQFFPDFQHPPGVLTG